MKKPKMVLTEVDENGDPIRIFKFRKKAFQYPVESVNEFPYAFAVGQIRRQVFARAGCSPHQNGNCEWCGRVIKWYAGDWDSGEMHEVVPKGKGGEVSITNSVAICRGCHTTGPNSAHGERRWHTAKLTTREM